MKKIIGIFFLMIVCFNVFGQGNDTTKYIKYDYQYGIRQLRLWAKYVLESPDDTVYSKTGLARKGSDFYVGNNVYWQRIGDTTNIYNAINAINIYLGDTSFTNQFMPAGIVLDTTYFVTGTDDSVRAYTYTDGTVVYDTLGRSLLTSITNNITNILNIIDSARSDTTFVIGMLRIYHDPNSRNDTLKLLTFTIDSIGGVPPPLTVTGKFLRDDGTWQTAGGGTSRFGIEDNTGVQDRSIDMTGYSLTISKPTGFVVDLDDGASDYSNLILNQNGNVNIAGSQQVTMSAVGALGLRQGSNNNAFVNTTLLSNDRSYSFPDTSGIIPLSVNGNYADATGNITISTGGGSQTLQQATDASITATDNPFINAHNNTFQIDSTQNFIANASNGILLEVVDDTSIVNISAGVDGDFINLANTITTGGVTYANVVDVSPTVTKLRATVNSIDTHAKLVLQKADTLLTTPAYVWAADGDTLKKYSFPSGSSGTVTTVTGTSPIVITSTPTTTPNVTIPQASGSVNGFLASGDWTTFNGKQAALTGLVGTLNYKDASTSQGKSMFVGEEAGDIFFAGTQGIANTVVGYQAGKVLQTGTASRASANSILGYRAGLALTTGSFNALFGTLAGSILTTQDGSTLMGYHAGVSNTGVGVTALGYIVLGVNTANYNTAGGYSSMQSNTSGSNNTAWGNTTLFLNVTSTDNTAVGHEALYNTIGNTGQGGNTAVGSQAGKANTSGVINSFFGERAGFLNTTGVGNTFIGRNAGLSNSTGTNNVYIGRNAADAATGGNNIVIGASIGTSAAGADNELNIGGLIYGVNTYNATTGRIGIRTAAPTASLHLPAGSATASLAPLKFTAGTRNSTPEAGTIEYETGKFVLQSDGLEINKNSALSAPSVLETGTWITGGSATTTKPHHLIEPSGTTSAAWSTSGTGLGVNAPSGFTGNIFDGQLNGVSKFKVSSAGALTTSGSISAGGDIIPLVNSGIYAASSTGFLAIYNDGSGASLIKLYGSTHATTTLKNTIAFKSGANIATSGTTLAYDFTSSFAPTSGTAVYNAFSFSPTINQTGGANGITRGLYINPTLTAAADFRAIDVTDGKIFYAATNTATGTTGAQTINKIAGKVNFAAGAGTLVVTNSLVTTSSIVTVTVEGTDATATSARVTLAAGSFTITLNANATAETKVAFIVIN